MILGLNERPQDAVAAIDASGAVLRYGGIVILFRGIGSLLPVRSLIVSVDRKQCGGNSVGHGGLFIRVMCL